MDKKKRSGFAVMCGLIRMVKPLAGFMTIAVIMGIITPHGNIHNSFRCYGCVKCTWN